MSGATRIEPDIGFKKELIGAGGDTLTKCFQCGTCVVACPLSPDTDPFPRKEVLWAQWGLKDRLMADPDVWLCHQCNDCAQLCPREANPGDVLAVVRQSVVENYASPGFLAKWLAAPRWLPLLFAIPAVLMLVAIAATGGFRAGSADHHGFFAGGILAEGGGLKSPPNFDYFFAHYPIILFFTGFVILSLVGALSGLVRYWNTMKATFPGNPDEGNPSLLGCAVAAIKDILTHKKFRECEATANRYWGHFLLFYGFAGMFVTTALAALLYYIAEYPFGFFHPVKLLGNVSGVVFLVGLGLVIAERLKAGKTAPRSGYVDWLFIVVIGATVVTGIICQAARLAGMAAPAYVWYFIHLLFVFFLLVYLPYSKFAHLFYRTVAMMYAHSSGREREGIAGQSGAEQPQTDEQEQNAA